MAGLSAQQKGEIRISVIRKVDAFTDENVEANPTPEPLRLEKDLGIYPSHRMMLSVPFTKVSRAYGGKALGPLDCVELETVKACIDAVIEKAEAQ